MELAQLFGNHHINNEYDQNVIDILRLIRTENVGPRTFIDLINLFGNANAALEHVEEFSQRGGKKIKPVSQNVIDKELSMLAKENAYLVSYQSSNYSKLLLEIYDFPPILTYKGNIKLLNHHKSIAIVGARNASINGQELSSRIARQLADRDCVIVSGLARGIDTAAHKSSVNKTIAVIAGGIDNVYPPENLKLYKQIAEYGLIVSELPIGKKPLAQHFPQRNRIISGLSIATVLIEAGLKSGSLITARFALEQNRDIFAVPGFPLDPRSMGTNKLIKEGAYLLESIDDILDRIPNYDNFQKSLKESKKTSNQFYMNNDRLIITNQMRKECINLLSSIPISIESMINYTNFPLQTIYTIILELELAGKISRYPGNKIALIY
ncbi:MAG: DNA-processing protein DprA [Rickettsiaceae bacterium]